MISLLFGSQIGGSIILIGILLTFFSTGLALKLSKRFLPKDKGRANAVQGALSIGKVRGAGLVMMVAFALFSLILVPFSTEYFIYCILMLVSMLSGFLDDMSDVSWSDYKKGAIDFVIAVAAAITYVVFNPNAIGFGFFGNYIEINKVVYVILAVILIWISINVTNCSDGVDGLCGSLSLVTLLTFYRIFSAAEVGNRFAILLLCAVIMAYLWFNTYPSTMLMGDAGSRAIGFFIAIIAMKSGHPLAFFAAALVLILDGGLGLVKVFVIRFFKIQGFMKKLRTPLHDHARKNKGWQNVHVVYRFTVLQIMVSLVLLWAMQLFG